MVVRPPLENRRPARERPPAVDSRREHWFLLLGTVVPNSFRSRARVLGTRPSRDSTAGRGEPSLGKRIDRTFKSLIFFEFLMKKII